jgi:putative ABC transport system permease protein
MNTYGIDYDFIELLEMKIVQGRSFSRSMADTGSYIINETAARSLNRENLIGTKLALWGKEGPIVGVVKKLASEKPMGQPYGISSAFF